MSTSAVCDCCQQSRITVGAYKHFDPLCLWCGSRLIQSIQRLRIPPPEKVSRCRAVLARWMAHGHSEKELRRLALVPTPPYQPVKPSATKRKKEEGAIQ